MESGLDSLAFVFWLPSAEELNDFSVVLWSGLLEENLTQGLPPLVVSGLMGRLAVDGATVTTPAL